MCGLFFRRRGLRDGDDHQYIIVRWGCGDVERLRKICWVYVFDPRQLQHTLFQVPAFKAHV